MRVLIEAFTDALGGTGMIGLEPPRETTRRDTEWSIAVVLKTTSLDAASWLGHQGDFIAAALEARDRGRASAQPMESRCEMDQSKPPLGAIVEDDAPSRTALGRLRVATNP